MTKQVYKSARGKPIDFVFTLYNAAGGVVATDTVNQITNELVVIDCSPATIVANATTTTANFENSARYTVQAQGSGLGVYTGFSEEFEFWIDFECKRYPVRRLHWLNILLQVSDFFL